MAEAALQAELAGEKSRTHKLAGHMVKAAQEAPETLTGRRAVVTAKLYDLAHGSNMYDLLLQRRAEERDLAMAKRLGLITADRCIKHERQLAKVRGM
jgi:hypothetical protein